MIPGRRLHLMSACPEEREMTARACRCAASWCGWLRCSADKHLCVCVDGGPVYGCQGTDHAWVRRERCRAGKCTHGDGCTCACTPRGGPDKCRETEKHECVCGGLLGNCKSETHRCVCVWLPGKCKAGAHACLCGGHPDKCISEMHVCACYFYGAGDDRCRGATHESAYPPAPGPAGGALRGARRLAQPEEGPRAAAPPAGSDGTRP